jgi:hypothetical protein
MQHGGACDWIGNPDDPVRHRNVAPHVERTRLAAPCASGIRRSGLGADETAASLHGYDEPGLAQLLYSLARGPAGHAILLHDLCLARDREIRSQLAGADQFSDGVRDLGIGRDRGPRVDGRHDFSAPDGQVNSVVRYDLDVLHVLYEWRSMGSCVPCVRNLQPRPAI